MIVTGTVELKIGSSDDLKRLMRAFDGPVAEDTAGTDLWNRCIGLKGEITSLQAQLDEVRAEKATLYDEHVAALRELDLLKREKGSWDTRIAGPRGPRLSPKPAKKKRARR